MRDHFARLGHQCPPVEVRGLYEHTCAIAGKEGRSRSDVALEAVLGAVIRADWSPAESERALDSCESFIGKLSMSAGKREAEPVENRLVHLLNRSMDEISKDDFVRRCEEVHTIRPIAARTTEGRFHKKLRAAVRANEIELWR